MPMQTSSLFRVEKEYKNALSVACKFKNQQEEMVDLKFCKGGQAFGGMYPMLILE